MNEKYIDELAKELLSDDDKKYYEELAEERLANELDIVSPTNEKYKGIHLYLSIGKLENELKSELEQMQRQLYNIYNYKTAISKHKEYLKEHVDNIESIMDYHTVLRIMLYDDCYSEELAVCFFDKYISKALSDATEESVTQLIKNIPSDKYSNDILSYVKSLYKNNDMDKKKASYRKLYRINATLRRLKRCTDEDKEKIQKILEAVDILHSLNGDK